MLFFFKEKPIEIVAFVDPKFAFAKEFSPIAPARDYFPDWWKNTPSSFYDWANNGSFTTAKSCPGIISILTTGFVLPLWCDLAFKFGPKDYSFHFSDKITSMEYHDNIQSPGFYEDYIHLKIQSPWLIRTPVKMMYQQPIYLKSDAYPFTTPYGIVPPVKNYVSTNIFTFFKKPEEEMQMYVKQGTPILHIIPMTDKKVTLKVEVLDESEYTKVSSVIGVNNHFTSKGLKNLRLEETT